MQWDKNTILITGGGTGIGRALAESFAARGNTVIVSGRRQEPLDALAKAHANIHGMALDVGDGAAVASFCERIKEKFPALNVLVNNAGIMKRETLLDASASTQTAEQTVATNLLGPICLIHCLLGHLKQKEQAAIINVSSGLAFVPLAHTPTYCATKAALHSYTMSLRWQLRRTAVELIELIPPYVATELMDGKGDPNAMPLPEFIDEAMALLQATPTPAEVCVQRVRPMREAERKGKLQQLFEHVNTMREQPISTANKSA